MVSKCQGKGGALHYLPRKQQISLKKGCWPRLLLPPPPPTPLPEGPKQLSLELKSTAAAAAQSEDYIYLWGNTRFYTSLNKSIMKRGERASDTLSIDSHLRWVCAAEEVGQLEMRLPQSLLLLFRHKCTCKWSVLPEGRSCSTDQAEANNHYHYQWCTQVYSN